MLSWEFTTATASVASFTREERVSRNSQVTSAVEAPSTITTSKRSCAVRIAARAKSGHDSTRMSNSFRTRRNTSAALSSTQTSRADRVIRALIVGSESARGKVTFVIDCHPEAHDLCGPKDLCNRGAYKLHAECIDPSPRKTRLRMTTTLSDQKTTLRKRRVGVSQVQGVTLNS